MILQQLIGPTIRQIRKEMQIAAIDVAEKVPMSRAYLSEIENGHRVPSIPMLADIAKGLDLSVTDLWSQIGLKLGEQEGSRL